MNILQNPQNINIKPILPVFTAKNRGNSASLLTTTAAENAKSIATGNYAGLLKAYNLSFAGQKKKPADDDIAGRFSSVITSLKKRGINKEDKQRLSGELKKLQREYSIETRVMQAKGKECYGAGLFNEGYVDFKKVGWEHLKKEPLDWEKASDAEIMAFRHAAALAETYENPWVKRFNYINVSQPLATYHSISKRDSKERYGEALLEIEEKIEKGAKGIVNGEVLKDLNEEQLRKVQVKALKRIETSNAPFLDQPIINPETGEFNVDLVVFDTETTGLNINHENHHFNENKPPAKILQIGAVKISKGGEISSELNQLVNPETPIEEGASRVHGIYDEDVKGHPTMKQIFSGNFSKDSKITPENRKLLKGGLLKYFGDGPIVAYNANFDISLLNSEIRMANEKRTRSLEEKKYSHTIDPFVLVQRLHPFVGASKKLTDQYRLFFARDLEGAHDALADVKATTDMLKYCCLYLNKHYNPPEGCSKKALTVRDVLRFQFGDDNIKGLDIKLHQNYGFDRKKRFSRSYRIFPTGVKHFPAPFTFNPSPNSTRPRDICLKNIVRQAIGEENLNILAKTCAKQQDKPEEGQEHIKTPVYRKIEYKLQKNLRLYLFGTGAKGLDGKPDIGVPFKPYNGMHPDELKELFISTIKNYEENNYIPMWMKDIRPEEEFEGNDLPDVEIIKKVMCRKKSPE